MPPPTWVQTWARRSRLRPSSQVPHRAPTAAAASSAASTAAVIALDDELLPLPIAHLPPPPAAAARKREIAECIDSDDDDEVVDPQYQLFLDHLKPEGKAYRIELPALSLRYEDDGEVDDAVVPGEPDRKKNRGYVSDEADEDYRVFTSHVRELPDGSMILEFADNVAIRYEEEAEEAISLGEDGGSGSVVDVDEDYLFFIRHARQDENEAMVFELDDNVVVNYEEVGEEGVPEVRVKTEDCEDESGLSSTRTVLRPSSGSSEVSNYLTYEDDGCSVETDGCEESTVYGEKLKDVLDQPFDQSEYERLLQLAELCTPVEVLRVTRSVSKTYPTNKLGRSYLDYYPKLGKMVEDADPHKRLYLLRGLFFWLKNLAHEGAFKPWECASLSSQTLPSTGHIPLAIEISEN